MAEDTAFKTLTKELKDNRKETIATLNKIIEDNKKIVDNTNSTKEEIKAAAKDQLKAAKARDALQKMEVTLGKDLKKNFADIGTTITGGIDGILSETFGPLGGIASSLTVGFFKRQQENKKNLESDTMQVDAAQVLTEEMQTGKEEAAEAAEATAEAETAGGELGEVAVESAEETAGGVREVGEGLDTTNEILTDIETHLAFMAGNQESAESRRERLRNNKGAKAAGGKKGKVTNTDDGGFFPGLGMIASVLGGIALGLTQGDWIPPVKELKNITSIFDTKFPKWTKGINNFFNIADDLPKIPDAPKIPKTSLLDDFAKGIKTFFKFDVPKIPGLNVADDVAGATAQVVKYQKGLRTVFRNAAGKFISAEEAIKLGVKGADTAADASKATTAARTLFGVKVPGIFSSVGDKIADVGKSLDSAKDIIKTQGLAKGLTKVAGTAATKVVGGSLAKAFRIAGSPVFDVAAMGKDMYDVASATMDDDITTEWKKEDVGAIIGGVVGGAIGMAVGMPWLGVGLGNMAGEFIGAALDQPEVIAGIQTAKENVENELTPVKARITETTALIAAGATERAALQDQLKVATTEEETQRLTNLLARNAQQKIIFEELNKVDTAKAAALTAELTSIAELQPKIEEVKASALAVKALYQQRNETEAKIEKARQEGNAAAVKAYQALLVGIEEDIVTGEATYKKQNEELRKVSQETNARVAEKTTNILDQLATTGNWFGTALESMGLAASLEGSGKTKLLIGAAEEEIEDAEKISINLEKRIALFKDQKTSYAEGETKRLENQLKRQQDKIKAEKEKIGGLKSGDIQAARTVELEELIKAEEDKIEKSKEYVKTGKGDDVYKATSENFFGTEAEGQSESLETIAELRKELSGLNEELSKMGKPGKTQEEKIEGQAKGGFIVNRPTYLPSSGIVVGESKGYAGGGLGRAKDGRPELVQMGGGPTQVYPLGGPQADEFIKPVARQIAGATMNQWQSEMAGAKNNGGGGAGPIVTDASSNQTVINQTTINSPNPQGPPLPGSGRDMAVSHFRHVA